MRIPSTKPKPAAIVARVAIALAAAAVSWPVMGADKSTDPAALVKRLAKGGYVLFLRHPQAYLGFDAPDVDWRDCARQRGMSRRGVNDASTIGAAWRKLKLPIGEVRVSPLCRTRRTARLVFGARRLTADPLLTANCRINHRRMAATRKHLANLLSAKPKPGTNNVLLSHECNLFGVIRPLHTTCAHLLPAGAAAIFQPLGARGFKLVGCIPLSYWRAVAR